MGKSNRSALLVRVGVVAALIAIGWFARGIHDGREAASNLRRVADSQRSAAAGFELELWARTAERPAHSTMCLLDGEYGMTERDGQVFNRNSHVDFEHHQPGCLTVAIQGGDLGQIIDLGDEQDLASAVDGPPLEVLRWHDGSVIAEGDEFVVPDPVNAPNPPSSLDKVRRWLAGVLQAPAIAPNSSALRSAQVKPGHVYFVRIAARRDPTEIVALILVEEYDVGKRVKLRCVQL